MLYSKAIELESGCDNSSSTAILFANRSMCHLNMNKAQDAVSDAEAAVSRDPSYVKGYYRLAMAKCQLGQYVEAREGLVRGLTLKPDDKELQTQLAKVDAKLSSTPAPSVAAVPRAANTVTTKSGASTNNTTASVRGSGSGSSSGVSSSSSSIKGSSEKVVIDEDDEDLKNLNVRGYKKTVDGKMTTFFNNEMDEQTKQLIGSIAPKKLDVKGEVITTNAPATGSAWNSAGTYEEKILTSWATESLRERFTGLSSNLLAGEIHATVINAHPLISSALVEVTSVEEVTGDAQVTLLRGKKKHVCDYVVALKWNVLVTFFDESSPISVNGQLKILDISADREYEVDQIIVSQFNDSPFTYHSLPKNIAVLVNKFVKDSDSVLQKSIERILNAFWDDLKSK